MFLATSCPTKSWSLLHFPECGLKVDWLLACLWSYSSGDTIKTQRLNGEVVNSLTTAWVFFDTYLRAKLDVNRVPLATTMPCCHFKVILKCHKGWYWSGLQLGALPPSTLPNCVYCLWRGGGFSDKVCMWGGGGLQHFKMAVTSSSQPQGCNHI